MKNKLLILLAISPICIQASWFSSLFSAEKPSEMQKAFDQLRSLNNMGIIEAANYSSNLQHRIDLKTEPKYRKCMGISPRINRHIAVKECVEKLTEQLKQYITTYESKEDSLKQKKQTENNRRLILENAYCRAYTKYLLDKCQDTIDSINKKGDKAKYRRSLYVDIKVSLK